MRPDQEAGQSGACAAGEEGPPRGEEAAVGARAVGRREKRAPPLRGGHGGVTHPYPPFPFP